MQATAEEIAAMRQRMAQRRAERIFDAESDEVIAMTARGRQQRAQERAREQERREAQEMAAAMKAHLDIAPARRVTAGELGAAMLGAVCRNGVYLLVLGMTAWMSALLAAAL